MEVGDGRLKEREPGAKPRKGRVTEKGGGVHGRGVESNE